MHHMKWIYLDSNSSCQPLFFFILTKNNDVGLFVEVSPPPPHWVGLDLLVLAVRGLGVELDVDAIDSVDVPFRPGSVLPLNLIGSDPSIEVVLINVPTEPVIPATFLWSHRTSPDLSAWGLGLYIVGDEVHAVLE